MMKLILSLLPPLYLLACAPSSFTPAPTVESLTVKTAPEMEVAFCVADRMKNRIANFVHWVRFEEEPSCWVPLYELGYSTWWNFTDKLLREHSYPELTLTRCPGRPKLCALQTTSWLGSLKEKSLPLSQACSPPPQTYDPYASRYEERCAELEALLD